MVVGEDEVGIARKRHPIQPRHGLSWPAGRAGAMIGASDKGGVNDNSAWCFLSFFLYAIQLYLN